MDESFEALLTREEVSKQLNVSLRTVDYLKSSGALPFVKVGVRGVRFKPEELRAYVTSNTGRNGVGVL